MISKPEFDLNNIDSEPSDEALHLLMKDVIQTAKEKQNKGQENLQNLIKKDLENTLKNLGKYNESPFKA